MKLYTAGDKLDKTYFTNYDDWQTYPTADYCCNECQQIVAINLEALERHWNSSFTNLNSTDQDLFDAFAKDKQLLIDTSSFLDFYCPTCRQPVRIYYNGSGGGRHGEVQFQIRHIVLK